MSFVDTMGPFVFWCLFGFALVIGVLSWVTLYLVPKSREISARTRASVADYKYNQRAKDLVDCIIAEDARLKGVIPNSVTEQAFALKDYQQRKGIR